MLKNRSDLMLAKFEEANKSAKRRDLTNIHRLHA